MPALPFNATPSGTPSPSSSPTMSPTIILHSPTTGAPTTQVLHKAKEDAAEAYKRNYARYLAATFNMSFEAAMSEADSQLSPRRSSSMSEAESLREI